ncbi:hypothetical protein [Streptomyces sp. sk226]|uniref:hypothetical protein n=1 Tax=Streptomyces sp. sk226 TaxID=2034268 RepID=UPI0015CF3331|nr:hypothetical protein [Streptomyces sp. sk226]
MTTQTATEVAEPAEQPVILPAPRSALEAARLLADAGHHVHYASDGQVRCLGPGSTAT